MHFLTYTCYSASSCKVVSDVCNWIPDCNWGSPLMGPWQQLCPQAWIESIPKIFARHPIHLKSWDAVRSCDACWVFPPRIQSVCLGTGGGPPSTLSFSQSPTVWEDEETKDQTRWVHWELFHQMTGLCESVALAVASPRASSRNRCRDLLLHCNSRLDPPGSVPHLLLV